MALMKRCVCPVMNALAPPSTTTLFSTAVFLYARRNYLNRSSSSSSSSCSTSAVNDLQSILSDLTQTRGTASTTTNLSELKNLHQLSLHLLREPKAAGEVWRRGGGERMREMGECGRGEVEQLARVVLSLLGQPPPLSGRGVRILAVDGGGTRGIIPVIFLRQLEKLCGLPAHLMFDYVCGTSTGAMLAAMVFLRRAKIEEIEEMYHKFSVQVFKMNNLLGLGQLFLNHAFYDTKLLEKVIRTCLPEGEQYLYETRMDPLTIPFSMVSTVINQPVIQPFLFTNYRHHPHQRVNAHYQSDCTYRVWEAIMASTAAPGYFEEAKLDQHVFQDGALLANNPTAIALHEARLLWGPQTPIQTIVSLGTGFYSKPLPPTNSIVKSTSLKDKLTKVVLSATDTEAVHTVLKDLLPHTSYYRFNPELSDDVMMDESDPTKLQQLVLDAESYVSANEGKMVEAAQSLLQGKVTGQRMREWVERGWRGVRKRLGNH